MMESSKVMSNSKLKSMGFVMYPAPLGGNIKASNIIFRLYRIGKKEKRREQYHRGLLGSMVAPLRCVSPDL